MPPLGHVRTLHTHNLTWQQIVNLYRLTLPDEEPLKPSWNVTPTHVMPLIRPAGNGRELVMAGWGLIPFLAEARSAR
jgi:putative SOS response-associated peptidase YedK